MSISPIARSIPPSKRQRPIELNAVERLATGTIESRRSEPVRSVSRKREWAHAHQWWDRI